MVQQSSRGETVSTDTR